MAIPGCRNEDPDRNSNTERTTFCKPGTGQEKNAEQKGNQARRSRNDARNTPENDLRTAEKRQHERQASPQQIFNGS